MKYQERWYQVICTILPNGDQHEADGIFDDVADVVSDNGRDDAARFLEPVGVEDAQREGVELLPGSREAGAGEEARDVGEREDRGDDDAGPAHGVTAYRDLRGHRGYQEADT